MEYRQHNSCARECVALGLWSASGGIRMIPKTARRVLSVALSFLLVFATGPAAFSYQASAPPPQEPAQAPPEGGNAPDANQPAPHSPEQTQALVAPIALYPDALVAQVLSAATFPDQVALAQNWLQEHKDLSGDK